MRAAAFTEPGPPEVLRTVQLPDPHAGPGQVRVRVKTAGVQPFDAAIRAGWKPPTVQIRLPQPPGNEFAGVVDEGTDEVPAGTEVLGFSLLNAYAEYIVVDAGWVTPKPPRMAWEVAGGFTAGTQTAHLALSALGVGPGDTLLIHGAAGAVGGAAVQLARLWGATVLGTASPANHEYLRSLGAVPIAYGDGLLHRVRAAAPGGVHVVLDGAGGEALEASLTLVEDRKRVLTLVEHSRIEELGLARIEGQREAGRLAELAELHVAGELRWHVRRTYSLDEAAEAHREIETGHGRGKVVLRVS